MLMGLLYSTSAKPCSIQNTPIFNTMQDAMDLWHHLLDQIYHYEALDSFTGNAPKSIKQYVLEEAPE